MKNRTLTRRVLGIAASIGLLCSTTLSMSGCSMIPFMPTSSLLDPTAPFVPTIGSTFTLVTFPVDLKFENAPLADSYGASTAHNVLGLVAWGDASVYGAAQNGQLQTVDYVDARYLKVWFIYNQTTIEAYGRGGIYPDRASSLRAQGK